MLPHVSTKTKNVVSDIMKLLLTRYSKNIVPVNTSGDILKRARVFQDNNLLRKDDKLYKNPSCTEKLSIT